MCWVEGVLVVVSVPASHDSCLDNKLYLCHCFSPLQKEEQHHLVSLVNLIMSMSRCEVTECLVSPVSCPTHLAWSVVDMEWVGDCHLGYGMSGCMHKP